MSEPGFEKVLEIKQGECSSGTLVSASTKIEASTESPDVFDKGFHQVSGGEYISPGSEDEAVDHLLVELVPEYIDSVRNVLQFDASSLLNCFTTEKTSILDYRHIESNADEPDISLMPHEKTTQKSEEKMDNLSSATNDLPDTYEDYLLDDEFLECIPDMNSVPSKGHSMGYSNIDHCGDPGLSQYNSKKYGWCTSAKLVSESEVVKKSSSLDKMTVDEVIMVVPKVDEISPIASNPLTGVFNFKTKPRGRHMRRYKHTNSNYLKTFSVEDKNVVSSLPDLKEKFSVKCTKGKYKLARRCTDKSVTTSLRFPGQKCDDSVAVSKGTILPTISLRQCHRDGLRPRVLVHGSGKNISDVGLTRAPFGPPLDEQSTMEKGHEFEDSTDSVSPGSDMEFDTELYSLKYQEFSSEDSFVSRAKTHKRKRHIQWSLEEVLQLVDGVSEYGVGRWTDIKRVLFSSSAHRSSVDLKDKWRNLLRATCRYFESKKRGGRRKFIETQVLPKDILHRVRELSLIYPYPRERNSKVSRNSDINISIKKHDSFLPLTVKV